MCLIVILVSFLLTSPFVVLDFNSSYGQIMENKQALQTGGHSGADFAPAYNMYWAMLVSNLGYPLLMFAIIGVIFLTFERRGFILMLFPLIYLAYMSSWKVAFERYLVPVIPFLIIASGYLFHKAHLYLKTRNNVVRFSVMLLFCVLAINPLLNSIVTVSNFVKIDTRTVAKEWIEHNIPNQTSIAYESYCPKLNQFPKGNYTLFELWDFPGHPWEYYKNNSVEYVCISSFFWNRYYNEPSRYQKQIEQYDSLRKKYLVARFSPGEELTGPAIEIYKIK
jgi:hypothetical protein